jgi:hypothetical protein
LREIKGIEDERAKILEEFDNETKVLELKFDAKLQQVIDRRKEKITQNKELYSNFWLRVLSNHKLLKDFIAEEDKDVLKHLTDIRYKKLDDGLVI